MRPITLGLYHPADTWLHRLRASTKLIALVIASIVVVAVRGPLSSVIALVVAFALLALSRAGMRAHLRMLRAVFFFSAFLAAYHLWRTDWQTAVEQAFDLIALVVLATVLTVTTTIEAIVDVITRALEPFRRFGASPEKVALAFSLVIRSVPILMSLATETMDAARARGLERSPRTWLTPFVIRTVAHARDTGDALHARGIGDDDASD